MDDVGAVRSLQLLKRYALPLVLAPAVAVAAVVALGVRGLIIRDYGRMVASGVEIIVEDAYAGADLSEPLTAEERNALDREIGSRVERGFILGLHVVTPEGRIAYSTDAAQIGTAHEMGARQRAALEGEVAAAVGEPPDTALPEGFGPVVVVTGPVMLDGRVAGFTEMYRPYSQISRSIAMSALAVSVTVLLGALTTYVLLRVFITQAERGIAGEQERLADIDLRLGQSLADMERHSLGTLQALIAAIDAKDSYTARHSVSVTEFACTVAREMGLDDQVPLIERAGLLHDIGKIAVPERVLLKPARLNAAETEAAREHARVGAEIITTIPFLDEAVPIVRHHHERWDGNGYPDGLAGEQAPLLSRVLAVADAWDAMVSDRPYRAALPLHRARQQIEAGRGTQFDPAVVDAFLAALERGDLEPPSRARHLARA